MSQYLALEWNECEARLSVASSRGSRMVVEQAFVVSLEPVDNNRAPDATEIGKRIAEALDSRGLDRPETLVSVGRSHVELRELVLPPAPDDELPEMVRFQAMREFNALEEDWPLDYVSIDGDPQQSQNVLAVALSPDRMSEIHNVCEAAGLQPKRLILRPCSAASLVLRGQDVSKSGEKRVQLLVDLLAEEADMTVTIDQTVIFPRCTRLSGDPLTDKEAERGLLAEIRRTMAAVQNRLEESKVESLVLCGRKPDHTELARTIGDALETPIELFDPFDLELGSDLQQALPDHPGRFAPLLGALADEISGSTHAIDFLNPRRRPAPPNRRHQYTAIGLAVASVVAAGIIYGLFDSNRLKKEIRELQGKSASLDKKLESATKLESTVEQISEWESSDVVWLDELRWLSEKLPPAEEVKLGPLNLSSRLGHGEIPLKGVARDLDVVASLEQTLDDERHDVAGKTKREDPSADQYRVVFSDSVFVRLNQPMVQEKKGEK